MKAYYTILLFIGITSLFASFLPILLKKFKISYTIPLLIFGALLYYIGVPLLWPSPIWDLNFSLHFSEMVVVISLMVAGLKIGLNYTWKEWKNPIRLLAITMPLFMLFVFLVSYYILDFSGPVSALLAAVLAPTDPALASEIQLGNKQSKTSKNTGVRYSLTSEAGLNDGLTFPFIFLAIIWSKNSSIDSEQWIDWISFYLLYKVIAGVLVGATIGFLYSYLTGRLSKNNTKKIHQAFVALSLTLIAYGSGELINSYGFLSVFFAGLFAHYHKHTANENTNGDPTLSFISNVEKFLIIFWMIFFGGSVIAGILNFITIPTMIFSFCLVLIVRPILGYISLFKTDLSNKKKWAVSFFGIRGIGSVFYLTYAIKFGNFEDINHIYSIVALVILISIFMHGLSARRVMASLKES